MEMLGEALQVAPVEELDPDLGVLLAQLAQLPVLAGDERLLHGGDLDVEGLLREEEVGRERFGHAPLLVLPRGEGPGPVFPPAFVVAGYLWRLGPLRVPQPA